MARTTPVVMSPRSSARRRTGIGSGAGGGVQPGAGAAPGWAAGQVSRPGWAAGADCGRAAAGTAPGWGIGAHAGGRGGGCADSGDQAAGGAGAGAPPYPTGTPNGAPVPVTGDTWYGAADTGPDGPDAGEVGPVRVGQPTSRPPYATGSSGCSGTVGGTWNRA